MKTTISRILAAFVLGGVMLPPLKAGNEIFLYPLARAFGSPSESELAKCRQAFSRLQSGLGTSRVAVTPVLFVDGGRREWRPDLAEAIIREAGTHTTAKLAVAAPAPVVAPAALGRNQLRYTWERAAAYAEWVKAAHPAADYIWFVEIWGHDGKVGAIQVYVLDARGQVAYCRLFNSHQFGPNLPLPGDEPVRLLVRRLFEDLQKDPNKIFPPYGVG
jgi:hypothetical protein